MTRKPLSNGGTRTSSSDISDLLARKSARRLIDRSIDACGRFVQLLALEQRLSSSRPIVTQSRLRSLARSNSSGDSGACSHVARTSMQRLEAHVSLTVQWSQHCRQARRDTAEWLHQMQGRVVVACSLLLLTVLLRASVRQLVPPRTCQWKIRRPSPDACVDAAARSGGMPVRHHRRRCRRAGCPQAAQVPVRARSPADPRSTARSAARR
jgi:hypothetical protein